MTQEKKSDIAQGQTRKGRKMAFTLLEAQSVLSNAQLLHTSAQVENALDKMASKINAQLAGDNPLILCVLTGGIVMAGQLLTRLSFSLEVDYIHATRYRNTTQGYDIEFTAYPQTPINGRSVLIVDDIFDEGYTLAEIVQYCHGMGASKVQTAVLVEKKHDRKCAELKVEYVGLEVDDHYVFGYGMDYKGYLRNAAGIYAVRT